MENMPILYNDPADEMLEELSERDERESSIQYRIAFRAIGASNESRPSLLGGFRVPRSYVRAAMDAGIDKPILFTNSAAGSEKAYGVLKELRPQKYGAEIEFREWPEDSAEDCLSTFIAGTSNATRSLAHDFGEFFRSDVYLPVPFNCIAWNDVEHYRKMLVPGGKAAIFLPTFATSSCFDVQAREYLLSTEAIEAVIELPYQHSLSIGGSASSLIILGQGGEAIRFVDATDLSYEDNAGVVIETVINRLESDCERSCTVWCDEVVAKDSILKASCWTGTSSWRTYVPLSELTTRITRGTTMSAKEIAQHGPRTYPEGISLKERRKLGEKYREERAQEGFECEYVTTSRLDKECELKEISLGSYTDTYGVDERQSRYLIQNEDILVSKMPPYKVVMARLGREDDKALASGNLFVISLDQARILPQYLLSYLQSAEGWSQLIDAVHEQKSDSITKTVLDNLMIPVIDLDSQEKIATEYERLRGRYFELKDEMRHLEQLATVLTD